MKRKKILLIILSFLLIAGFVGFLYYQNEEEKKKNSPTYQLMEIGYSEKESKTILEKLGEKTSNLILNNTYNKNIISLLNDKDFKNENLEQYIEAMNLFSLDINDIVYIVNSENYHQDYAYDSYIVQVMKEKYYISSNLDRYIQYHQKNKDIASDELITQVNSNLDYEFYTNPQNADTSKGYLILVNKYYRLKNNYVPQNLVSIPSKYGRAGTKAEKKTYEQFIKMYNAAAKEGLRLYITSPYRSYNRQNTLYTNYTARDGKKAADTYSARPGYSEHQTGLALDILSTSSNMSNFTQTKEYQWLLNHAHQYGFILRYPKGKEYITGYMFESWHYRYVGEKVAKYIKENNITFEEYYAYYIK